MQWIGRSFESLCHQALYSRLVISPGGSPVHHQSRGKSSASWTSRPAREVLRRMTVSAHFGANLVVMDRGLCTVWHLGSTELVSYPLILLRRGRRSSTAGIIIEPISNSAIMHRGPYAPRETKVPTNNLLSDVSRLSSQCTSASRRVSYRTSSLTISYRWVRSSRLDDSERTPYPGSPRTIWFTA